MKAIYFFVAIFLIGILSCKKELITETEFVYLKDSWTRADDINRSHMFITNSFSDENRIAFGTPRGVIIKTKTEKATLTLSNGSFNYRGTFYDDLFIQPLNNPVYSAVGIASYDFANPNVLEKRFTDSLPEYKGLAFYGSSTSTVLFDFAAIRTDKKQYIYQYAGAFGSHSYCLVNFSEGFSSAVMDLQSFTFHQAFMITLLC